MHGSIEPKTVLFGQERARTVALQIPADHKNFGILPRMKAHMGLSKDPIVSEWHGRRNNDECIEVLSAV
jgi:hypothetical protein